MKINNVYDICQCFKGAEWEWAQWDPKGGELYLDRGKVEETLLEARNNTDVQIVCKIWV